MGLFYACCFIVENLPFVVDQALFVYSGLRGQRHAVTFIYWGNLIWAYNDNGLIFQSRYNLKELLPLAILKLAPLVLFQFPPVFVSGNKPNHWPSAFQFRKRSDQFQLKADNSMAAKARCRQSSNFPRKNTYARSADFLRTECLFSHSSRNGCQRWQRLGMMYGQS